MSTRDKKLLVYLGALIIIAAAYFFFGRPYLDKINALSTEKTSLEMELKEKKSEYENKDMYEQGITDANARIGEIISMFPEDNTDEKSIMFASHAEAEIPIWFSQMSFAAQNQKLVNGGDVPSASDAEQQQLEENVAAAEGEEVQGEAEGGEQGAVTESSVGGLIGRNTDLGLTFQVEYDNFKKFLEYLRDYDERIVLKDISISYSSMSNIVSGNLTLSQYAILGGGRELPEVVTGVESLGTDNVFMHRDEGGSILDLIADMASDFLNKLMGGLSEEAMDEFGTDYFVKVNAVTDNTSGVTAGKADDPAGRSYITGDRNDTEQVIFSVSGSDGKYKVKYTVGEAEYEDETEREEDGKVYLRIISTERANNEDKVAVSLHVHNTSDIPVVVNIEGDDNDKPRVSITEKNGEVTVNE